MGRAAEPPASDPCVAFTARIRELLHRLEELPEEVLPLSRRRTLRTFLSVVGDDVQRCGRVSAQGERDLELVAELMATSGPGRSDARVRACSPLEAPPGTA